MISFYHNYIGDTRAFLYLSPYYHNFLQLHCITKNFLTHPYHGLAESLTFHQWTVTYNFDASVRNTNMTQFFTYVFWKKLGIFYHEYSFAIVLVYSLFLWKTVKSDQMIVHFMPGHLIFLSLASVRNRIFTHKKLRFTVGKNGFLLGKQGSLYYSSNQILTIFFEMAICFLVNSSRNKF